MGFVNNFIVKVAEFLPEISGRLKPDPQLLPVPGCPSLPPCQVDLKKIYLLPLHQRREVLQITEATTKKSADTTNPSNTINPNNTTNLSNMTNPSNTTNPSDTTMPAEKQKSDARQSTPGTRHSPRLTEALCTTSAESKKINFGMKLTKLAYAKDVESPYLLGELKDVVSPEPLGESFLSEVDELILSVETPVSNYSGRLQCSYKKCNS
jgi:hypothetical protein